MLRAFLEQSFVTKSDITTLLRQRGIFVSSSAEKKETVPLVTSLIISPREFDFLRESQKTKEDSQKVNTKTISWNSDVNLLESTPDNFDINSVLDLEFSNFTVVSSPNFIPVDDNPNHLLLEFEIERNDLSKNWFTVQNKFKGSLDLRKIDDDNIIEINVTHTAKETKYVTEKVCKGIVNHFEKKGYVDSAHGIRKIEFDQFSNSSRINYFLSLTQGVNSEIVKFNDLSDVEFSPELETGHELPEKIKWMENKINDLKLNGKGLQHTFFIEDKELHPFVQLHYILAKYKFDHRGITGDCEISFSFPEYSRNKDMKSELEINIKNIQIDHAHKNISRIEIEKIIFREFDRLKRQSMKKIKPEYFS